MTNGAKIFLIATILIILGGILFYQNRPSLNNEIVEEPQGKLPAGSDPVPTADIITGLTWVWDHALLNDGTRKAPNPGESFTLTLGNDGRATGKTDCNSYFATYAIGTDGVITFSDIGATKMFCEDSQEMEFIGFLTNTSHYTTDIAGNLILLLKFDSGSVQFTQFES